MATGTTAACSRCFGNSRRHLVTQVLGRKSMLDRCLAERMEVPHGTSDAVKMPVDEHPDRHWPLVHDLGNRGIADLMMRHRLFSSRTFF